MTPPLLAYLALPDGPPVRLSDLEPARRRSLLALGRCCGCGEPPQLVFDPKGVQRALHGPGRSCAFFDPLQARRVQGRWDLVRSLRTLGEVRWARRCAGCSLWVGWGEPWKTEDLWENPSLDDREGADLVAAGRPWWVYAGQKRLDALQVPPEGVVVPPAAGRALTRAGGLPWPLVGQVERERPWWCQTCAEPVDRRAEWELERQARLLDEAETRRDEEAHGRFDPRWHHLDL